MKTKREWAHLNEGDIKNISIIIGSKTNAYTNNPSEVQIP